MIKAFEKLIYPIDIKDFREKYFAKKYFKGNLSLNLNFCWDSLNEIINTRKVLYENIFLLNANGELTNPTSIFQIEKHCSNNGNFMINNIHYHHNHISELIFSLINDLKCVINTKLFVTYKNNADFNFSYNTDIFLICLEGNMNIKILDDEKLELKTNEYVYIPSNSKYSITSNNSSILLEVSIKYNTANDFLEWFITKILLREPSFYEKLPLVINEEREMDINKNWVNIIDNLKNKFIDIFENTDLENEYYNFLVKNQEGEKLYKFPYVLMEKIIDKLEDHKFIRKDYMDSIFEEDEELITIYFWKNKIVLDNKFKKLLKYIFNIFEFNSDDIKSIDNNLSDSEIIELLNTLIKNGIIEIKNK